MKQYTSELAITVPSCRLASNVIGISIIICKPDDGLVVSGASRCCHSDVRALVYAVVAGSRNVGSNV